MSAGTFAEGAALLALLGDDVGAAQELLDEMLPGELLALEMTGVELARMAHQTRRRRAVAMVAPRPFVDPITDARQHATGRRYGDGGSIT